MYDDPYDDEDFDDDSGGEPQPGECDQCPGSTAVDLERAATQGLTPVCACAIGQGAGPGNCVCGPDLFRGHN